MISTWKSSNMLICIMYHEDVALLQPHQRDNEDGDDYNGDDDDNDGNDDDEGKNDDDCDINDDVWLALL